eukprot:GHRR01026707.1.p1 GENE.GHRR01026707.1~~GHRR01026707.1.p1  ORF type:complete len:204 (+),score=30.88 GHRR01026707.1:260-871(+)
MDWSNVTAEELVDALREVDWNAPRPVWEFLSKFSVPKNQSKWTSRLKCNVYYYRTNYLMVLACALIVAFLKRPLSLLAAALSLIGLLSFNDSFASSLNDTAVRILRKLHPRSASLLRSRCSAASSPGSLATSSRHRQGSVKVLGLQRPVFVLLLLCCVLYCLYASRGWINLVLAVVAGEPTATIARVTMRDQWFSTGVLKSQR